MEQYIQFDRQSDSLASLDELCSCLERVKHNEFIWKYAIISAHNALQGYLCIALSNGNSFETWKDKQLEKWLVAYSNKTELPNPQLNFFMELFDKVFKNDSVINRENIKWLNETRNGLIHFNTDGYSIERNSVYECCLEALSAIKLTPTLAQGIFFYSEAESESFMKACSRTEKLFCGIQKT